MVLWRVEDVQCFDVLLRRCLVAGERKWRRRGIKGEGNRGKGKERREKREGEGGRGNRKGGEKVEGVESYTDQMLTHSITLHTVLHNELQTHTM